MEVHSILRSLLTTTTVSTTTTTISTVVPTTLSSLPQKSTYPKTITSLYSIVFRLLLISFVGILAIWANHEASKGFAISVVNDANKYTFPGKQFSLLFESNDKAKRIMLNTSRFVENLLYPSSDIDQDHHQIKKQINSVTLRLAPTNLPTNVTVDLQNPHEYLITLSPSLMETSNYNEGIVVAVLQGMARVWLWDGKGTTPVVVLNGIVEYITNLAGFKIMEIWKSSTVLPPQSNEICWKDENPKRVAGFLRYCDEAGGEHGGGQVVRRLNDGMRSSWHDEMMDDALGMPGQHACASYNMMIMMMRQQKNYSSS